jgi:glucan 1,3-beta-glucosidase
MLILKSGAVEMLSDTATDTIIYAANNTQSIGHPFWSILGAYLDDYSTEITSCDDDDETADCETEPDCDVTLSFDTMDALAAVAGSFPDICTDYYALGVLGSLLDAALAKYSAANDGYDSVFGNYVDYTKEMVPSALTAFMADGTSSNPSGGAGNKYFSCKFVETAGGGSDTINYDTCPIPESQYDYVDAYTMTYTLKDSDGFFSELSSTYGINESWVEFSTVRHHTTCTGNSGGDGGRNLDKRCDTIDIYDVGIPVSSGNIVVCYPRPLKFAFSTIDLEAQVVLDTLRT